MRVGGRAGQRRAKGGVGRGAGAIIFICDTLYQPNANYFNFSSRYLPRYGLNQNSPRNLLKGCNSKNGPKNMADTRLLKDHFYKSLLQYLQ